jgi:hypothetical protein
MSVNAIASSSDYMSNVVGKPSEKSALAESAEYNRRKSAEAKGEDPAQTIQEQIIENHMRLNNILREQQEALINARRSDPQSVQGGHPLNVLVNAAEKTQEKSAFAQAAEYNRKRAADDNGDASKRIRVSPDIRTGHEEMIAEHLRLSIKLKEQQEALINARRGSSVETPFPGKSPGQLYTSPSGQKIVRNGNMLRPSIGVLPPMQRTPMMDGGLKIWTESPFNKSPPTKLDSPRHWPPHTPSGNMPQPNVSPPTAHVRRSSSSSMSKDNFLKWCENLFEQHEKSEIIVAALLKQTDQARMLINSLKSAGNSIESRVVKSFKEQNQKLTEKYVMALTDLHRRTAAIEERLGLSSASKNQAMSSEIYSLKSGTPSPRVSSSPNSHPMKSASPPPKLP